MATNVAINLSGCISTTQLMFSHVQASATVHVCASIHVYVCVCVQLRPSLVFLGGGGRRNASEA